MEEDDATVSRLDVIGEHRDYCPWVNKESQGREPGWKALWKIVGLQMGAMGAERRVVDFYSTSSAASPVTSAESADALSAASTRIRALSTPVPGAAVAVESLEDAISGEKPQEIDRVAQSQKNESRLKRLKTVYFGGGKKKRRARMGGQGRAVWLWD